MAEFCICGASRDQPRPRCYFSTDPTVVAFDFKEFFDTLRDCINQSENVDQLVFTDVIGNSQEMLASITEALNFLANHNLDVMEEGQLSMFHDWADNCRYWLNQLNYKVFAYRLGFDANYYTDRFWHFANTAERRINALRAPPGMSPQPILSAANSLA